MENRVVFITGAARGIGLEMVQAFSQAGANVVISDLTQEAVN